MNTPQKTNLPQKTILLIFSLFCTAAFLVLLTAVLFNNPPNNNNLVALDLEIDLFLRERQTPSLLFIATVVSFFASTIFMGFVSAIILLFRWGKKEAKTYSITVLAGTGIGIVIKQLVQRTRPENIIELDYSFPSLHALAATLFMGWLSLILWKKKRKVAALLLLCVPLAIGASRIVLGVHWFSDVLGGFLLGGAFISFLHAYDYFLGKRKTTTSLSIEKSSKRSL
ncbi:phosphatase PAP2 family protein [Candidatus Woesearchaeota archaeon]|nr:phosphatase PAP2 family protein [Candidatus Woesearchaeota archaeon]